MSVTPSPDGQSPTPEIRRFSRREQQRRLQKLARLVVTLSVVLAELIVGGILFYKKSQGAADLHRLATQKADQEQHLAALVSEQDSLALDLSIWVQTRYPNLRKLEWDKIIPLALGPLENVRLVQVPDKKNVLEAILTVNSSRGAVPRAVKILFFDHLGVQLAVGEIRDAAASADSGSGEPQWVSQVTLGNDVHPTYFALETDGRNP